MPSIWGTGGRSGQGPREATYRQPRLQEGTARGEGGREVWVWLLITPPRRRRTSVSPTVNRGVDQTAPRDQVQWKCNLWNWFLVDLQAAQPISPSTTPPPPTRRAENTSLGDVVQQLPELSPHHKGYTTGDRREGANPSMMETPLPPLTRLGMAITTGLRIEPRGTGVWLGLVPGMGPQHRPEPRLNTDRRNPEDEAATPTLGRKEPGCSQKGKRGLAGMADPLMKPSCHHNEDLMALCSPSAAFGGPQPLGGCRGKPDARRGEKAGDTPRVQEAIARLFPGDSDRAQPDFPGDEQVLVADAGLALHPETTPSRCAQSSPAFGPRPTPGPSPRVMVLLPAESSPDPSATHRGWGLPTRGETEAPQRGGTGSGPQAGLSRCPRHDTFNIFVVRWAGSARGKPLFPVRSEDHRTDASVPPPTPGSAGLCCPLEAFAEYNLAYVRLWTLEVPTNLDLLPPQDQPPATGLSHQAAGPVCRGHPTAASLTAALPGSLPTPFSHARAGGERALRPEPWARYRPEMLIQRVPKKPFSPGRTSNSSTFGAPGMPGPGGGKSDLCAPRCYRTRQESSSSRGGPRSPSRSAPGRRWTPEGWGPRENGAEGSPLQNAPAPESGTEGSSPRATPTPADPSQGETRRRGMEGSSPRAAPTPADRPRRAGGPGRVGRRARPLQNAPAPESGTEGSSPRAAPTPADRPRRAGGPGRVGRRARPPTDRPRPGALSPGPAVGPPRRPARLGQQDAPRPGSGLGLLPATPRALCPRRRPSRPALRGATSARRRLRSDSPRAAMREGNPQPGVPPTTEATPGERPEAGRPRPAGRGLPPLVPNTQPLSRARNPTPQGAGGPAGTGSPQAHFRRRGRSAGGRGPPCGGEPASPKGVTSGRGAVSAGGAAGGVGRRARVPAGPRPPGLSSLSALPPRGGGAAPSCGGGRFPKRKGKLSGRRERGHLLEPGLAHLRRSLPPASGRGRAGASGDREQRVP
ncbi:collagen alpha-1(I) chain-like [Zalophus californianus]|uniref:Collagen alpha-1(I) chain-like n=1 Tax=Zalophus californianus TaxID=9704 RepID=A0A6P9EY75_ZALCA|nr:collagen alpha-1(I) chain-like [Zalophus californianus]